MATVSMVNGANWFDRTVSADAAGIILTSLVINRQLWLYHDSGDAGLTQLYRMRDAQLWRHIEFHPDATRFTRLWTDGRGGNAAKDENMYCTVKEIIREVLDTDVPDSECVFAVVLTRGDVRHIAQDWSLTDDELETVMQRLDDAFEYGADVSVVHGVVRELMEEKRASRQVTVPAVMLEKVMALAGSEMKRLYAVGSENGGDGDAFVREEREAMDVVLQALDGETMS
ncbi:hypothetical protein ECZU22_53280 [Escherichia coli]|nr:hypothetical protein ECZU22_53280 [Escherichia coli]